MYSIYRQFVAVHGGGGGGRGGGVELGCRPYSTGVLHSVSDQIQYLQNCFTTPNKMTSKDAIKGFVSLKFRGTQSLSTIAQNCWSPSLAIAKTMHPSLLHASALLFFTALWFYLTKKSLPNFICIFLPSKLCSFGISVTCIFLYFMLRCVGKEGVWRCRFKLDFFKKSFKYCTFIYFKNAVQEQSVQYYSDS